MVSEEKVSAFLKLQQLVLEIEDSTKLLEHLLPSVLKELNLVGYPVVFIGAVFLENLIKKGSEWEMKILYGDAAVISDVGYFINSSYSQFSKISSLLLLPIQH